MLYAALTFWLLVIVFSAWGVHSIWSGLIKPRVVNSILLPGTLVAQLGNVLGLLVTGQSVENTQLMGDDESGEPKADAPEGQKLPVIGPIITGLLPLLACGLCLYLAASYSGVAERLAGAIALEQRLPVSIPGVFALLRSSLTAAERLLGAFCRSDVLNWWNVLFVYLAICLTVRMAPLPGNRRGALGAIVLAGVIISIVDSLPIGAGGFIQSSWPILSFAVAMLITLLLVSLVAAGLVGLVRVLGGSQ